MDSTSRHDSSLADFDCPPFFARRISDIVLLRMVLLADISGSRPAQMQAADGHGHRHRNKK
jgi:hypothetical protein